MFRRINFRLAHVLALSVFSLGAQAFAQFEVSPDHFDSSSATQAHRRAAKTQAKSAPATTSVAARRKTSARKNKRSVSQPQTTAALKTR